MSTSSLLLLRRCLWYGHGRRGTLSPWYAEDYTVRRFFTSIVVGPQGYVEYGAPADDIKIFSYYYVHRIINRRLMWRCHRTTWTIYMYSRLGCTLLANLASPTSHSSQAYIWYAYKISSFINHLHEQYVVHQLPFQLLNDIQWQRW